MTKTLRRPNEQHTSLTEPMWTLDDVAAYTRLTKPALYSLRHLGRGPVGYKVGRQLRFRLSDVNAWLEQTRDEPGVVA